VPLSFPLQIPAGTDITSAEARRAALLGRADVLAALADYAAAEATLRLEIAKQYPDVHVGTGYQYDQGDNKWNIGISSELPLLNRNQGPIAEALTRRAEFAARFTAVQARAIAEMDRALAAWRAAQEQLAGLAPLEAALLQQAESVRAEAKAGAAEPLEVLHAEAELAANGLAMFDAHLRAVQALGQLEDAWQRPFGALRTIEQGRELSGTPKQP
jgi:outer membrane protein, heavy metal efflux system